MLFKLTLTLEHVRKASSHSQTWQGRLILFSPHLIDSDENFYLNERQQEAGLLIRDSDFVFFV